MAIVTGVWGKYNENKAVEATMMEARLYGIGLLEGSVRADIRRLVNQMGMYEGDEIVLSVPSRILPLEEVTKALSDLGLPGSLDWESLEILDGANMYGVAAELRLLKADRRMSEEGREKGFDPHGFFYWENKEERSRSVQREIAGFMRHDDRFNLRIATAQEVLSAMVRRYLMSEGDKFPKEKVPMLFEKACLGLMPFSIIRERYYLYVDDGKLIIGPDPGAREEDAGVAFSAGVER